MNQTDLEYIVYVSEFDSNFLQGRITGSEGHIGYIYLNINMSIHDNLSAVKSVMLEKLQVHKTPSMYDFINDSMSIRFMKEEK